MVGEEGWDHQSERFVAQQGELVEVVVGSKLEDLEIGRRRQVLCLARCAKQPLRELLVPRMVEAPGLVRKDRRH